MTHRFDIRVYYEDTDMAGIVYHANYLRYIERARSDWVSQQGLDQNAMRADGVVFVVSRIEADFRAPARFDDRLIVETEVAAMTKARLVMNQVVKRGEDVLFTAVVTAACATLEGRPTRLPARLQGALAGGQAPA